MTTIVNARPNTLRKTRDTLEEEQAYEAAVTLRRKASRQFALTFIATHTEASPEILVRLVEENDDCPFARSQAFANPQMDMAFIRSFINKKDFRSDLPAYVGISSNPKVKEGVLRLILDQTKHRSETALESCSFKKDSIWENIQAHPNASKETRQRAALLL